MIFLFIQLPSALYRNGRRPNGRRPIVTYPPPMTTTKHFLRPLFSPARFLRTAHGCYNYFTRDAEKLWGWRNHYWSV